MTFPSTHMYCSYRSILEGHSSLEIIFLMEFPHDEQLYFDLIVNWHYSLVIVQAWVILLKAPPSLKKILHFSMTTHVVAVQSLKHKVTKPNSINSLTILIIVVFFKVTSTSAITQDSPDF